MNPFRSLKPLGAIDDLVEEHSIGVFEISVIWLGCHFSQPHDDQSLDRRNIFDDFRHRLGIGGRLEAGLRLLEARHHRNQLLSRVIQPLK